MQAEMIESIRQERSGRKLFRLIIPRYPAFNIYSRVARITTALGPAIIATVANKRPDWDVEVIDENNYRRHGPQTVTGDPDQDATQRRRPASAVGFYGGLTCTIPRLYELAIAFKRQGIPTIAGGQHFVDDNIRDALDHGIDYVVIGEGEETIGELLECLHTGSDPAAIRGLAFLRDGAIVQTPPRGPFLSFDRLPVPDFSLLRHARIRLFPVGWVRGCGMNCEFCTVKGKVRCPPAEYAMAQISAVVERYDGRHFFLVDDLFGQHRGEALRFCHMLRDYQLTVHVRLSITVQIRLDKARDAELLLAMRKAGINMLAIGFESPIPEELAAMDKRLHPEEMRELTQLYRKAGFLVHGMFIFGYPMLEGVSWSMPVRERIRLYRQFIRRARIDTVQILLPVPLPGTAMTDRLARLGRVFPRSHIGWEYYDGNFPLFEPDPPLTPEALLGATRLIMGRFYRFRYLFSIGFHVLAFPSLIFAPRAFRRSWQRWYRSWRMNLLRFSGWIVMKHWISEFDNGVFMQKLNQAMQARQAPNTHGSAKAPHSGT